MTCLGYVRFGVALLAALGLHALIFFSLGSLYPTQQEAQLSSLLQVSILPQKPAAESSKPETKQVQSKQKTPPLIQRNELTQANMPQAKMTPLEKEMTKADAADAVENDYSEKTNEAETLLVPQDIQTIILAKVSYPRRARRHGWQGEAELRFQISRHKVQSINILASTGFDVLDQAAWQALASITSLPLSDGSYRLPVIFRLQ